MVKKAIVAWGYVTYGPQEHGHIEQLARFDLIATASTPKAREQLPLVKERNPTVKILGYRDFMGAYPTDPDWSILDAHEDWFIHDLNGARLQRSGSYPWYLLNINNTDYQEHVARQCLDFLQDGTYDGVFADDIWTHLFQDSWTVDPSLVPDWNKKVNEYTEWQTAMRALLSHVKSRIGGKLLLYNGPWEGYIDVSDGRMLETFGLTHEEWRKPIDDINDLSDISSMGKYYMANGRGTDNEHTFLFSFCCFLLGVNGPNAYYNWLNIWSATQGYYPQMDLDFGNPRGPYYHVEGELYGRDFDHYKIFANLSETETYTIDVEGETHTLAAKSGLLVPWEGPPIPPLTLGSGLAVALGVVDLALVGYYSITHIEDVRKFLVGFGRG